VRDAKTIMNVQRGSRYQHVGIAVQTPRKYLVFSSLQKHLPDIYYDKQGGFLSSYWRALRRNALINMPWPWRIKIVHSLNEHQKRLNRVKIAAEQHKNHAVNKTLDELYEELVMQSKK